MEKLKFGSRIHFSLLALASGEPKANFTFLTYVFVFHLSTSLVSFYSLVCFFSMLNFITLKVLYFLILYMFYHFICSIWGSDRLDLDRNPGFPTQKLCRFGQIHS